MCAAEDAGASVFRAEIRDLNGFIFLRELEVHGKAQLGCLRVMWKDFAVSPDLSDPPPSLALSPLLSVLPFSDFARDGLKSEVTQPLMAVRRVVPLPSLELLEEADHPHRPQFAGEGRQSGPADIFQGHDRL